MIIYIPQNKRKEKTNIRGFWYSKDTKKFYYDYIKTIKSLTGDLHFVEYLRQEFKQEAMFFTHNDKAHIFYKPDKINVLKNRHITKHRGFKGLKKEIKDYIRIYGGVTVYKQRDSYLIESWS